MWLRLLNKHSVCVGEVLIVVQEAEHIDATRHWGARAEMAVDDSAIKNQLQSRTLRGKVWRMLDYLDSLAGIIGAIDQVAKVHVITSTSTDPLLMWVLSKLNSYLDLAWKICSSLYKVRPYHALCQSCIIYISVIGD